MRIPESVPLVLISLSLCAVLTAGCERSERPRSAETPAASQYSVAPTSLKQRFQDSGRVADYDKPTDADTKPASVPEYEVLENEYMSSDFYGALQSAESSVVLVESSPPPWLEDFVVSFQQEHPFLRIHLFTSHPPDRAEDYLHFVPDLRSSYVVVDRSCVLMNVLYTMSENGLSYYVCDDTLSERYIKFAMSLLTSSVESSRDEN